MPPTPEALNALNNELKKLRDIDATRQKERKAAEERNVPQPEQELEGAGLTGSLWRQGRQLAMGNHKQLSRFVPLLFLLADAAICVLVIWKIPCESALPSPN